MGIGNQDQSMSVAELRRQAEERLGVESARLHPPLAEAETHRFDHELEVHRIELEMQLEVHQIELEMQNAELCQARDEVEALLERYTDLYDFAPVGYLTLDRTGVIRAVNLSGASLIGTDRALLLGRSFLRFLPVDERSRHREFLGKVFESKDRLSCEVSLIRGERKSLFVQIEAVADAHGRECRIAVIDITQRKRGEIALAKKRQKIDELNKALSERFDLALEELRLKEKLLIQQDRHAVMGEMINNIAHQWRQPLDTLGLIIQKLPLFYDSAEFSREFLEKNAAKAMKLVQHMSRTIDDFRNFFRTDKELVTFDVNQVIEQTLLLIEQSFQDQNIIIALQAETGLTVTGYPSEYAQVLLNILLNARDAIVKNAVADARISLRTYAEGGKTVVTVTDNGGGIAEEIMGRVFDPYFSTKGPDQGAGIGLFMSKTIIEKNMAGRLTVSNVPGGAMIRIEV